MPNLEIKENINLAPLTSFKIGGPARFFVEIKTKEEFIEALDWAENNKEDIFLLAGGSNVLINDKGAQGLVIKISNNSATVKGERIECGAGASLGVAVSLATGAGLSGLEWAIGIPGTIGGAVRGNAGWLGKSIEDIIETVEVLDIRRNEFMRFSKRDCAFGYRKSIFKENNNFLVWQAVLRLNKEERENIKEKINKYLEHRLKAHPKLPSPGCIFKNVDFNKLQEFNFELARKAEKDGAVKEAQSLNGNLRQVSAGWIIDLLGFKGKAIGGAKVSLEHANFIVNTGKATADDVVALISYIKQQVRDKFGIQLEEEIEYFGF